MSSIIDLKTGFTEIWSEISNIYIYLKYFAMDGKYEIIIDDVNITQIINRVFWIFLLFSIGFAVFHQIFYQFLKQSKIKYYKRNQCVRSIWNIAFYAASATFLYNYHTYIISPQLTKNTGQLFPTYDTSNTIFFECQSCDRFKMYVLVIITFHVHALILDLMESDYNEAASKFLYSLAITALNANRFENYFVILNLNQGIFNIITECLFLLTIQNENRNQFVYQIFLGLRIASWSHVFIRLLPFKYLIPTLFAKNFKFFLNLFIWIWYGLSIWMSPVLQYFYHQSYHNAPGDCAGEGSAAKCILRREETNDYRHYKMLKKAYLEVSLLSHGNILNSEGQDATKENNSAKLYHAMKCMLTLKRKLKRMREEKEKTKENPNESNSRQYSLSTTNNDE